jgi:hypothetical protein
MSHETAALAGRKDWDSSRIADQPPSYEPILAL